MFSLNINVCKVMMVFFKIWPENIKNPCLFSLWYSASCVYWQVPPCRRATKGGTFGPGRPRARDSESAGSHVTVKVQVHCPTCHDRDRRPWPGSAAGRPGGAARPARDPRLGSGSITACQWVTSPRHWQYAHHTSLSIQWPRLSATDS